MHFIPQRMGRQKLKRLGENYGTWYDRSIRLCNLDCGCGRYGESGGRKSRGYRQK
jgi:hypothetical protein